MSFGFRYKRGKDRDGDPIQHIMVLGECGKNGSGLTLEDAHEWQRKAQHSTYWTEGPSLCLSIRFELYVSGVGRYRASAATCAATN